MLTHGLLRVAAASPELRVADPAWGGQVVPSRLVGGVLVIGVSSAAGRSRESTRRDISSSEGWDSSSRNQRRDSSFCRSP